MRQNSMIFNGFLWDVIPMLDRGLIMAVPASPMCHMRKGQRNCGGQASKDCLVDCTGVRITSVLATNRPEPCQRVLTPRYHQLQGILLESCREKLVCTVIAFGAG
jgi:hypothetical protein